MINNMEGKTYEERLQCLKLWTLEERRNRQDLIEVFKICNGLLRIKLNELFTLDDNIKGTRGHSWKLAKFRCTRDCCKYFSLIEYGTHQMESAGSAGSWCFQHRCVQEVPKQN